MDLDDLPSCQGPKKKKPTKADKASLPEVPKFVLPTINLDESPVDVEFVQTIHLVQTETTPQTKTAHKPPSSETSNCPSNLVLDENYAWRMFKGIVTDNERPWENLSQSGYSQSSSSLGAWSITYCRKS